MHNNANLELKINSLELNELNSNTLIQPLENSLNFDSEEENIEEKDDSKENSLSFDSDENIDEQDDSKDSDDEDDNEDEESADSEDSIEEEVMGSSEDFFIREKWKNTKTLADVKSYMITELNRIDKNLLTIDSPESEVWGKSIYEVIQGHGVLLELLVNSEFDLNLKRFYNHEEVFTYNTLNQVADAIFSLLESN